MHAKTDNFIVLYFHLLGKNKKLTNIEYKKRVAEKNRHKNDVCDEIKTIELTNKGNTIKFVLTSSRIDNLNCFQGGFNMS